VRKEKERKHEMRKGKNERRKKKFQRERGEKMGKQWWSLGHVS
jgi:hypothetical protein